MAMTRTSAKKGPVKSSVLRRNETVRRLSLQLYGEAAELCSGGAVLLSRTPKFEFGVDAVNGQIILIDEVLTPDSSRFWPADQVTNLATRSLL
ncbi:MAG: phosphoribosylaminoimidazolesuccinocarboxamide synthase [Pyrinomonadaceae bacterium]